MLAHPDFQTKKRLGAYYTPQALTDVLASFALRSPTDTVLEPSFGGGAFIRSAIQQFKVLGSNYPEKQISGCDIDDHAFQHLPEYFGKRMGKVGRRFILSDFLEVMPESFITKKFDCILANPPFIGYKDMSTAQRVAARRISDQFRLGKNRYASIWYYFILNSLLNLKEGGRIAFVLPHAFIDNNYASSLRIYLAENFKSIATFSLPNRIFSNQGTKERVVVVVAQGWQIKSSNVFEEAILVNDFKELSAYLNDLKADGKINRRQLKCAVGRVSGSLTNLETSIVNEVINSRKIQRLGDIVDIKIGLVSGDANFFTLNKEKIESIGLSEEEHFVPLMRSLKDNLGLNFTSKDFEEKVESGKDCFLLKYEDNLLNDEQYVEYLNSYCLSKIDKNQTFKKREIWCEVDDNNVSDLFLTYMSISYPRVMLNQYSARCINNTHRGYFKQKYPLFFKKLICITMLTSFAQVLAELEAKAYGNKMLKTEPSFYSNLSILLPSDVDVKEINRCYKEVNSHLRRGEQGLARKAANKLIYKNCFSENDAIKYEKKLEVIRSKLAEIRFAKS